MAQKYSKDKTIKKLNEELYPIKLYKARCINWKGKATDCDKPYSEIIAETLIENCEKLKTIPSITREKTYFGQNHGNVKTSGSNRKEENFAKEIYKRKRELGTLGLIIDYQIPLKDNLGNKGLGKIDLISYNKNSKNLFLIELKYTENEETLLRAVLEIYTYYKIVDEKKLKKDFQDFSGCVDPDNEITIIPAVLLVPECNAYKELIEMEDGKRKNLKELSQQLGVRFFTIKPSGLSVNESKLQNP